jgi:hypothetical protein
VTRRRLAVVAALALAAAPAACDRKPQAAALADAAPGPSTVATVPPAAGSKAAATPAFWQMDPDGHFPNEGRDYCAPVALSDGLLCATGGAATKDAQVALIGELAKDLTTNPDQGTNVDEMVGGVRVWARSHGVTLSRLEVATWRPLGADNARYRVSPRPDLAAVRAAAGDASTVVLFNVGWYEKSEAGYTRNNGHWVDVIGAGDAPGDMDIRNPALHEGEQRANTRVTLTRLERFDRIESPGRVVDMVGYYSVDGPALPRGHGVAAVLDGVVTFAFGKP